MSSNHVAQSRLGSDLSIVILTFNEEMHVERCVKCALQIARDVYVVDSFSTDTTANIASSLGARVYQHKFVNHADQLEWAIRSLPISTTWVMRVDCDEIVSSELITSINGALQAALADVNGFLVKRYIQFQGKLICHGNFPQWTLRIWRAGFAAVEQRWMDEHVVLLRGSCAELAGALVDDNRNSVGWWVSKHNGYSSREAVDLLIARHGLADVQGAGSLSPRAARTRWMKEKLYGVAPVGVRAFMYFAYRMIFQRGLLDGLHGFAFHFLQGCWYRYLVDIKIADVERCMRDEGLNCVSAIRRRLGIEIRELSGNK